MATTLDYLGLGEKTKKELIVIIADLKETNMQLSKELQKTKRKNETSLWVIDDKREFRCKGCRIKAPKYKGVWGGYVQWKTPYCMNCGAKMSNGEEQ